MSLLIREMTVSDVMSCVVCCRREELLVSVCTRQKTPSRFLFGISSPFFRDELNRHFYGGDFIQMLAVPQVPP